MKNRSSPPNHCFLVGAVTGRYFNTSSFLMGAVAGRWRKLTILRSASDEWSGISDSPSLHSLTPQPHLRLPLPLHPQPQPQPHLHLLHPSREFQQRGGRLQGKIVKDLLLGRALAHFDHKIFKFCKGGSGSMDVRYYKRVYLAPY